MTDVKPTGRGGRPSKRSFILECAEALVQEKGAAHLTFDALTLATGISKGGLLYHFESKDALISAMLERYVDRRQQARDELIGEAERTPDVEIRALLETELHHNKSGKLGVDSAIIAATANNPQLMSMIHQRQLELFELLDNSSAGPMRSRIAWYAVLGHRLYQQFGLATDEKKNEEAFAEELLNLVQASSVSKSD